ncbi:hypothetical protein HY772_08580 [Candidatus Woesearchaeota archaeon]|nr:hypothetical protein [Candidatus Woesearchaeota archaeon]
MRQRGGVFVVLILTLTIALCAVALGAHNVTITFSPASVYETTQQSFQFDINNFGSADAITDLQATVSPLVVASVVSYAGWSSNYTPAAVTWFGGSIEPNVLLARFIISATAPKVDTNTTAAGLLLTTDGVGFQLASNFSFMVLDDATPPLVSNQAPAGGSYVKMGNNSVQARLTASDSETGVKYVQFGWQLCSPVFDNITNTTITNHPWHYVNLSNSSSLSSSLYQSTVDWSSYLNAQLVCFDILAENNGGASVATNGTATVDGTPPTVSLLSPDNGAVTNQATLFQLFATDNFASNLSCRVYVDATSAVNVTAQNNFTKSVPAANVDEGPHAWYVTCADEVGWENTSETRNYILDKTSPVITLVSPSNQSTIASSTPLVFNVTDNYGVGAAWYVHDGSITNVTGNASLAAALAFSLNPVSWSEGLNEVTVTAVDTVGNTRTFSAAFTIDKTPPSIVLLSPLNDSDVHVNFSYNVTDNYDANILCTLLINGFQNGSQNRASGTAGTISRILAPQTYYWSMSCADDANNSAQSSAATVVVVDLSAPDVVFDNPAVVLRGDDIQLRALITDVSNIAQVSAVLTTPLNQTFVLAVSNTSDIYSALFPTNSTSPPGTWTISLNSTDVYNNSILAASALLLTYRYGVTLTLAPSTVNVNANAVAQGTVLYDNGSLVPESSIALRWLAENANVSLNNQTGAYTHTFAAPSSAGTYTINAFIVPQNNYNFNVSQLLTVNNPGSESGGGGGGGGSGGGGGAGGGGGGSADRQLAAPQSAAAATSAPCTPERACGSWSECSNGKQERLCEETGCGGAGNTRAEKRSCQVKAKEESPRSALAPLPQQAAPAQTPLVQESVRGEGSEVVGAASGLFSLKQPGRVAVLLGLGMIAALLFSLHHYSKKVPIRRRARSHRQHVREMMNQHLEWRRQRQMQAQSARRFAKK